MPSRTWLITGVSNGFGRELGDVTAAFTVHADRETRQEQYG